MTEKIRADVALVKKNLCDSRERAQAAIMEGRVFFGNRRINKASEMIDESETLVIRIGKTYRLPCEIMRC